MGGEVPRARIDADGAVDAERQAFVAAKREAELDAIIAEENLCPAAARAFVEAAFRDEAVSATGTAITEVLPPVSRSAADGGHGEKKQRVLSTLEAFFERFFGLSTGRDLS